MNFTEVLGMVGLKIKIQEALVPMNNVYFLYFLSPNLKVSKRFLSSLFLISFCTRRENYNAGPKELLILTHWRFPQGRWSHAEYFSIIHPKFGGIFKVISITITNHMNIGALLFKESPMISFILTLGNQIPKYKLCNYNRTLAL